MFCNDSCSSYVRGAGDRHENFFGLASRLKRNRKNYDLLLNLNRKAINKRFCKRYYFVFIMTFESYIRYFLSLIRAMNWNFIKRKRLFRSREKCAPINKKSNANVFRNKSTYVKDEICKIKNHDVITIFYILAT